MLYAYSLYNIQQMSPCLLNVTSLIQISGDGDDSLGEGSPDCSLGLVMRRTVMAMIMIPSPSASKRSVCVCVLCIYGAKLLAKWLASHFVPGGRQ